MKRPRVSPIAPGEQSGFVLIGVVIMALALTILGLSLFSLSSYESQFLDRSLANDHAENKALGEIERAKLRLTHYPYDLGDVAKNLPVTGVVTKASQLQNGVIRSTGYIDWDNNQDVTIDVDATVADVTRHVTGRFKLQQAQSYYKRLVTSAGPVGVGTDGNTRLGTVAMQGRVWQNIVDPPTDTTWTQAVASYVPGVKLGGVATPDLQEFIAQPADETPLLNVGNGIVTYYFSAPSGTVRYFRHKDQDADGFTYESQTNSLEFHISGHVVWMLKLGLHLAKNLKVIADSDSATLTIVASPNVASPSPGAPPNAGIWLQSGISSDQVPVFLVSDGTVYLEQSDVSSQNVDTVVQSLSIFAANVQITGPLTSSGRYMNLQYPSSTNPVVDWLGERGALPNTSPAGNHRLALVPGTWKMSAP